jgi:acetolactate synthase-1/3 small subunit
MAMRRGHHTTRVMKALGTPDPTRSNESTLPEKSNPGEILPIEFHDDQEED